MCIRDRYYSEDQKERLARALNAEKYFGTNNAEVYTMDITPYSYQQEILDKLEAERTVRGYTRNLVVAATGTGKTVISALDYKRCLLYTSFLLRSSWQNTKRRSVTSGRYINRIRRHCSKRGLSTTTVGR